MYLGNKKVVEFNDIGNGIVNRTRMFSWWRFNTACGTNKYPLEWTERILLYYWGWLLIFGTYMYKTEIVVAHSEN